MTLPGVVVARVPVMTAAGAGAWPDVQPGWIQASALEPESVLEAGPEQEPEAMAKVKVKSEAETEAESLPAEAVKARTVEAKGKQRKGRRRACKQRGSDQIAMRSRE